MFGNAFRRRRARQTPGAVGRVKPARTHEKVAPITRTCHYNRHGNVDGT